MKNYLSVKRIAFIAIFSALTCILYMYVKFNLPIFPSFLDINLSMIPVIICAFMLGPVDGGICVIIRCVIKLLIIGTGTSYVGEIADVIIGLPTAFYAGAMYNYTNFKHKELYSFVGLIIVWVVLGILTNYFINIPFYVGAFFKGDINGLIYALQPSISLISFNAITVTENNYMLWYILLCVVPFNLLIALIVTLVTLPIHKRLKSLYLMFNLNKS